METQRELPKYRCHKEVHALKIKSVELTPNGAIITPEDEGFAPFGIDKEYLKRLGRVDGYYVVYRDGYKSWSPAEVFEAGYTLIE